MASRSETSRSKVTRTRILEKSAGYDVNLEEFHRCLKGRTSSFEFALKSEGHVRRILEQLAARFWLRGTALEEGLVDNWNDRRRNAGRLLSISHDVIEAAEKLMNEEVRIWLHFKICGTGRHTRTDVGARRSDITKLARLIKLHKELEPVLRQLKETRKPRIDDDENLFLYLMATYLNIEFEGRLSAAAIYREIATLVNAWGDSLVGAVGDEYELYERDLERRIVRFRENNGEAAAGIDSDPFKYIEHFIGLGLSFRDGLRETMDP